MSWYNPLSGIGVAKKIAQSNPVSGLGVAKDILSPEQQSTGGLAGSASAAYVPATPGPAPGAAYTPTPYVIQNRDPTTGPDGSTEPTGDLSDHINKFLDPDNVLNQRAEAAGLAQANSRGLLNSSMAVQAAQNSVLDRADALGRAEYAPKQQNWINQEAYNRDYVGTLAALPIKTYNDSLNSLIQASIDDPTLMDPDAMSGFANFFQQMSQNMYNNYKYADGTPISGSPQGGA